MRLVLIIVAIFHFSPVIGQFNSKIGYSGSFVSYGVLNDMFAQFDKENPWLEDNLSEISISHGLELGARYRINTLSFEIGVITGNGKASGVGISPTSSVKEDIKWRTSLFDYHFNITQHIKNIGIGFGLANQRLKMKEYSSVADSFNEVSNQNSWSGRVFLQLEVPSSRVSFALRPYYQFTFDSYDLSDVRDRLSIDYNGSTDQKLSMIGLSIIFFNGPQY